MGPVTETSTLYPNTRPVALFPTPLFIFAHIHAHIQTPKTYTEAHARLFHYSQTLKPLTHRFLCCRKIKRMVFCGKVHRHVPASLQHFFVKPDDDSDEVPPDSVE
jgi:hypothetical protein